MGLTPAFLATLLLAAQEPDPGAIRAAIVRALPPIEKDGTAWIREHDCLSCHHVPFLLWSHQEARAKGVEVDLKKLETWTTWSRAESMKQRIRLKLPPKSLEDLKSDGLPEGVVAKLTANASRIVGKEEDFLKQLPKVLTPDEATTHRDAILKRAARESGDGGGLDTMAQLLLAGTYAGTSDADFSGSLRKRISALQRKDGGWDAGGQIMRMNRSKEESSETTTLWTLLALTDGHDEADVERARGYVKDHRSTRLLEGVAVRLMLSKSDADLKELTGRQNEDGGWASLQGGASDAFATGQALYALGRVGLPGTGDAIARAQRYLLKTQREDGVWVVAPLALTSPETKPDRMKRLEPIYRFWGSAWAVIGLARSLPTAR